MVSIIYLPPFYEPNLTPVYVIGDKYYEITTLKRSRYNNWDSQSLFGIKFNPLREWKHRPILVRTRYGGFLLEIPEEGKFQIGHVPVKKALQSPILELYLVNIPQTQLPDPDPITYHLLEDCVAFSLSLEEYLGHYPVQDDGIKAKYSELIELSKKGYMKRYEMIPKFRLQETYDCANVMVIFDFRNNDYRMCVASYDRVSKSYDLPKKMSVERFI